MQSSIISNNNQRSSIIESELFIDDHLQISMFFNDYIYITIFRSSFDISLYKVLSHELFTQLNHYIRDYRKLSFIIVEQDNRQFEELRKSLYQNINTNSQISFKVSQYKYANYMVDRMYDFFEECDEANYVRSCSPFYNDEIKNYIFYRIGRCLNQQYMSYNPDLLRNLNIRTDEDSSIYSEFKSYFHTKKSKDQFTQQLLHPQSCSVNLLYFHERMKCIERNLSRKFICQLSQLIKQFHDIDQTLDKLQITPKISTTYTKLRSQVDAIIQIKELLQGAKYDPDQSDGLFEFKMFIQLDSKGFKDLQSLLYNDIIDIRGEQNIQFNEYVYHQYGQLKQKKQQYLREVKQIVDKFNNDQPLRHLNMRHKRWGQEYCLIISMKQRYIQDYYQQQFIEIQRIQKLASDEIEIFVTSEELKYINQRYKNVNLQLEQEITLILESIKKIVKSHEGSLLIHLRELGHVDFYLGVLRLKHQYELIYPVFNNQEMIIEQARNVLVKKNVPNDLDLDPNHKMLLVLGPNASGKSVYIKTIGQLIYLAHCGFPIAAKFANICILQNMTTYFCGQMEGIVQKQQEYQFLKKILYLLLMRLENVIMIINFFYNRLKFIDESSYIECANGILTQVEIEEKIAFFIDDLRDGHKIAEMECLPYDRLDQQFTQGQSYYTYQLIIKYQYEQYIEQNMFQAFKIHKNHRLFDMIKECYLTQERNILELNKLRQQVGYSRPNVSLQQQSESINYQQSYQSQIQENSNDSDDSDSEEMDVQRLQQLVDEQMRNNRNSYNDRTYSQIQLMEELNKKAQMIKQQRNQINSSQNSEQSYYEQEYDQLQTSSSSSPQQSEYSIISDDSDKVIQYKPLQQKTYNSQNDQYQQTRIDMMTRSDNSEININYAKSSLDWYQEQRQTEFIQPNTKTNKIKLRQSQIMYPKKLNSQK